MEPSSQTNIPPTRPYQQEMLDASLIQNVVIALDTGSGKTIIAVLRMKIECDRDAKKISWFIAPTVGLCEQQRDVISACLSVPVGLISGALQPDQWTDEKLWKQALSTHRIIVSTPQVLLDALRHGYVNLGRDIGLLVFDEAHHASEKHPYNMIMREFYDSCSPRSASDHGSDVRPFILGLTASPVFGGNIDNAFQKIEQNLDSVILAPRQTRDELAKHVHKPVFKKIVYQPQSNVNEWKRAKNVMALSQVVETLDIQSDPSVVALRRQLTNTTDPTKVKRIDQRLSEAIVKKDTFVNKGMRDFLRTAKELCNDIGIWAADWYVYNVINKALRANADALHLLFAERHHNEKIFLINVLRSVKLTQIAYDLATITRGCSPKANDFIAFLLHEKRQWEEQKEVFSGIIFITRRDGALALSELLRNHPCTAKSFSIGTLLGSSESNKRNSFLDITRSLLSETQSEVLNSFRIGEKNLVISTAVAEEGIDIQTCCSVFRWDLPQNMVSFAQSRGRARRKDSSFVLMFEDGGCHAELIRKWEVLEQQMIRKYNEDRKRLTTILPDEEDDEEDENLEYKVESTNAKVTLHSAISHVAHFCNTLRSVVRTEVQPIFDINPPDYPQGYHSLVDSGLTGGPLPKYPGPYGATLTLPRLLPPSQRVYSTEEKHKTKQAARRHVAFKAYVALHKAGLLNDNLLPLSSSIAPLQEAEVQNLLKDIEKREGMADVKQQLDPWTMTLLGDDVGAISDKWWLNELDLEGIGKFRMFTRQELPSLDFSSDVLYDPDFGVRHFSIRPVGPASLTGYETTAAKHYTRILFSIFYGNRLNWEDLDYSYLFLPPLDSLDSGDVWEERRIWAEDVRPKDRKLSARDRVTVQASQFTSQYHRPSDIVLVVSGSSTYRFRRWRDEVLTPKEEEAIRKKYMRFKDLDISYPLIEAQPLRTRANFLLPSQSVKPQNKIVTLLPQFTEVVLENKRNTSLSLFLPSILRATFIKLIAYSFQRTLLEHSPALRKAPLDLIQTVIIAPAADAHSNFERHEVLGDAVLKLITSVQLLAEHPTWPEAFLSKRKDHAVSNVHLAKSAIGKRLYRWIIRRPFLTRKWAPDYSTLRIDEDLPSDNLGDAINDNSTTYEQAPEDAIEEEESLRDDRDDSDNIFVKLSTKTLADVVEAVTGCAFLTGGFDSSIACVQSFSIDIGGPWKPLSERINSILESVVALDTPPAQLAYPEAILGYNFSHKMLLIEALMHASSQSDIESMSYERMEFLGDALLDMVVIETLYRAEAHGKIFTPGDMHIRKAALVNTHFLGFVCLRAHVVLDSSLARWDATLKKALPVTAQHTTRLSTCILHSSGTILDEQRDAFARFERGKAEIEAELESGRTFPWAALARLQAPKFLSDIIESTLGAVYLDSNGSMDAVKGVLENLGVMKVLRRLVDEDIEMLHPVSRVSEWARKNQKIDGLEYKLVQKSGNITCTLMIDGDEIASVKERYNGKASEDDVRFRVAEEGMKILLST